MLNLSDVIELKAAPRNDIIFVCPSQSEPAKQHDVIFRDNGQRVFCDCRWYVMQCAKHCPTERDTAHHCKHIKAALEFLNASLTIEQMDADLDASDCCVTCGQILEQMPVSDGCGDYETVWGCPCCDGEVNE